MKMLRFRMRYKNTHRSYRDDRPRGRWILLLEKEGEDKVQLRMSCKSDYYGTDLDVRKTMSEEATREVQQLIEEKDLFRYNGYEKSDDGKGASVELLVTYEDGKELHISVEGSSSLLPEGFDPDIFLDYFINELNEKEVENYR